MTFKLEYESGMQVSAYYTTHPPYTLTKVSADLSGTQPENYDESFVTKETGATITIEHLSGLSTGFPLATKTRMTQSCSNRT